MSETLFQQERLQAIAEKRKRQTEIENKKRQLEDERRQLQHLKSKALRERWLLEGTPSSAAEEDEGMKKQLQEDNDKTKQMEETILRLERELELLENGEIAISKENSIEEKLKTEEKVSPNKGSELAKHHSSPLVNKPEGSTEKLKAAMFAVEITVEKDNVTGETKVLSTSSVSPKNLKQQGVKVYEDDLKVIHEMRKGDVAMENGVHLLSTTEVDELIQKADKVTDYHKVPAPEGKGPHGQLQADSQTPEKLKADGMAGENLKILQKTLGDGAEPSKDQPVTMIFMGYQDVEDENETKKVLGYDGTGKAELVVIEDGDGKSERPAESQAPPNGTAAAQGTEEKADGKGKEAVDEVEDLKEKQRCQCCIVM
ncbi:paralemmin 1a isoform X3 [Stegostoma tigrinum]|nr:paralemmin 1a isoform X3 [Stegostoma tigrinum]XP_048415883.1 paralemmin 1a isoform X3 [Stegostoma tigrinum]XP_048415884.1 paralemmin 1a isoform X3 [Stegostoma tigrinum]